MSRNTASTFTAIAVMTALHAGPSLAGAGHIVHREPPADLAADYAVCAEAAERRLLGRREAQTCADIYFRLKLSLLGLKRDTYEAMPLADRASVNALAYEALLEWRELDRDAVE